MWINFEDSPFEDETISNAFSSRGIYRITSDKEVQISPQVQASVQNRKMVLAIDTTLFLLEDETTGKCNIITFESNIDLLLISATGNLILCSLSNGEVHGLSISGQVLFSPCIQKEDINVTGGRSFVSLQQLDRRYCLVCSNGSVYGFSEFDEEALEATLHSNIPESEVENVTVDILNHVTLSRLFSIKGLQEIKTSLLLSQGIEEAPLLLAGTCGAFYQRNCQEGCVLLLLPEEYNGVKHVYNLENKIILLTNSGHLLKYCPLSQLLKLANEQDTHLLIDDLIVMECNGRNIEFLILTKSNEKSRSIKMIDYPSFKCLNELEVGGYVWLVQQPKSSVNLYYISGQENNSKQHPTILELIMVSETDPSERYKKLINKGYLEEAEDFGKKFELCLQPIYEATAKRLLRTINAMDVSNPEVIEEQFSTLIMLFKKIEDKQFFREARMFSLPSRHILEKYLQEILKYLDNELDEQYIVEITEQLHRLKTLVIIDPYEVNSDWLKFVHHPNLIKYITGLFKTDMPLACLIWKRHASSLMSQLNKHELRKLMSLIPHDTKPFNFLQWLKVFVPIVYNTHPNVVPYITEWSTQKTRALQYSDHWPDIGLEFCTKVMEVFEEIEFMHSDVRRQHERNINKLRELVNALQDLFVLKKTYNLVFTLDNYLQDRLDETAKCILRRVHLDNLKSLINDFLYPIYQEKSQSPVTAIKCYISLLVASRNSFSCWLERSVACIELLHNEDDRLELALLILQNSPVPWPDVVAPLLKFRYSSHPLASKINTEYELQVIKLMKAKYGWPTDSGADVNLNLFAFRIVKMNLPDMLDDICILTRVAPEIAVSANFNCCYQLVKNGKLDVAYEFFKSLKFNNDSKCNCEMVELFANLLESSTFVLTDDKSLEEQCELIKFFKLIAKHADRTVPKRYEFVQNRYILLCKYGIKTNDVSEVMNSNNCSKFLDMGIENIIKRKTEIEDICKYFMMEMQQLSKALNMSIVAGIKQLCCRTNCLVMSCALAYNVMQLTDGEKINKDDYIDLALVLLKQQINLTESASRNTSAPLLNDVDPLAFPLAYELLTQASFQERNNLFELTELINYLRIARDNYAHNAIDELYNEREKDVMNAIFLALNTPKGLVYETTLNQTNNMNMSFDIKPEIEKLKKRVSVSIFDKFEETPQPASKSLADHRDHCHIVKFVAHTLLFLVLKAPSTNHLILHLKNLLTEEDKIKMDIDHARESFFLSLEHLIKTKKHRVWYTMAQYLINYQQRHRCNLINTDFLSMQMTRVLRNDMTTKNCNFLDLFVMLTADPHSHMLLEKLSQEVRTNQQKVNYLTLAEMYNTRFGELIQAEVMRSKRIKHYYYMEFCKQDSTLNHKFNAEIDSIEMLLKEVHNKQVDVQLLERVSRDFNLDYQKLLVTQILRLVKHVHNLSKAFLILYFVSNYAPDGADQVEASYECYKFVMTNEKLIVDPKCQEQLKKIKRNYPVIKTQHLLHAYGLNDDDLIKLVEYPSELIHRLYHHEIILKGGKLDINTLVKEIAELHDIKEEKIQFKLLQMWLSFTSDMASSDNTLLDETLYEDQNIVGTVGVEDMSTAAENVKRANYILASWPKDVAVQFLIGHMYPPEGMTNTSKQLQIYECYFKLYDGSTDLNNIFDQQQYIAIKCVHELKKLGYNSSLEKFKQSDKIDILKIIWQSNANNPHALQLLANICLGFDIHVDKIWNGILKRMVKSSMHRDLNALVDVLSCYAHLLHIEGLTKAWEWILLQPFKNANQTQSAEQEDKLHKTLFRLQSCPVVHSLNLLEFAEHCLRLGKHHMAAVLMAFCKTPEQRQSIKQLIPQRNETMRQKILELEDVGILSPILNFVLKELCL
ncbi:kinetochore component rough deal isoform 3-T4 [Glossina fuscipes fuscipes]